MNDTIDVDEAIQTINKQNKRIEELVLEIERLNNIIKRADDLLELKQLRYLNENNYRINTISLQEVRDILQGSEDNECKRDV